MSFHGAVTVDKKMSLDEKRKKWVKIICECGHNKLYHYNHDLTKELDCMGICFCKKFKIKKRGG